MGGSINFAVRFQNGDSFCVVSWTNTLPELRTVDILDNETIVRDYLTQYTNPVRLAISGYGLFLIDYVTKTIIDTNSYTSLFGQFHDFEVSRSGKRHDCMIDAINRGYEIVETQHHDRLGKSEMVQIRYRGNQAIDRLNDIKSNWMERNYIFSMFAIDISPSWRYLVSMGETAAEKKEANELIRSIGFPTSRKMGLNRNNKNLGKI